MASAALAFLGVLLVAFLGGWAFERAHRHTHPVPAGHRPEIRLPHEQEFELYHNALSLCSMKVRVCLAELGIAFRNHPIDLIETGAYENIGRRFLAVNPAGTVPVLVHRGHPVYESHEQIRYAAAHAPAGSPSLLPSDPKLRDEMERWVDRASLTEDPMNHGEASAGNTIPGLTFPLFTTMIEKIPYRRILEGLLFHYDRRRPLLFLALKARGIERIGQLGPVMRLLARSRRQLAVHLDALEQRLRDGGGPWILGEPFTLADVSWLVIFERLEQVDALHVFAGGGKRPECAAYWARLRGRPSHRIAIRDAGHPVIDYGTQRLRQAKAADPALARLLEGETS